MHTEPYDYPSWKLIYHENKPIVREIFREMINGIYQIDEKLQCTLSLAEAKPPKTQIYYRIHEVYENVQWFTLFFARHSDGLYRCTPVAKINTPRGSYIMMRNGNNISKHNILIFNNTTEEFHFRSSIEKALGLIKLLSAEDDELPLFVGLFDPKKDKENYMIFESRLKAGV